MKGLEHNAMRVILDSSVFRPSIQARRSHRAECLRARQMVMSPTCRCNGTAAAGPQISQSWRAHVPANAPNLRNLPSNAGDELMRE
jgi:hypothetical protein